MLVHEEQRREALRERERLDAWLAISPTSPITYESLAPDDLVPDRALQGSIFEFVERCYFENEDY